MKKTIENSLESKKKILHLRIENKEEKFKIVYID